MLYKLICITFFMYICNVIIPVESIDVKTSLGTIRGKFVEDETTGARYYSFEGIYYAEPPVGDLRFKPPVRRRPCPTIIDATKPGFVCPQTEGLYSRDQMSEDCLTLNIYTPANNSLQYIPVIFFIHNGDFASSSGNADPVFGPQLLILNEVVVVTVNYRLGALGFLSLCTEDVSGNAGLKDVLLALKIVREIIWRFGGDKNKITIMGIGAGAVIAELLMLTKQSNGLFRSAMLHSGSVLSSKYIQLYPRQNAMLLGRELGINLSNDEYMLEELINVNPFDIVEAQEAISEKDPQRGFREFSAFKPVVEIDCASAIIRKAPLESITEGEIHDVAMVIGFNAQEGVEMFPLLEEEPELIDKLNENSNLLIPSDIQYPYGSAARKKLTKRIVDFYFNGGNISFTNVQNYVNFISDAQYTFAIDYFVELFVEKKKGPVYYYKWVADTKLNWFKLFEGITYPGTAHLDDIGYIFLTALTKPRYKTLDPITKYMLTTTLLGIKNFVYNGTPNAEDDDIWPEAGKQRYHVIKDYDIIPVYQKPLPKRIGFWRSVYEEYFKSKYYTANYFCSADDVPSIPS